MKGIDFLKKIGHINEDMISEAANPIKKSRKWNGNIIKFAGLAACIAVFVGAICAGRASSYLKKDKDTISSAGSLGSPESLLPDSEGDTNMSAEENQEEIAAETNAPVLSRMVMVNGKLYAEVGESDIDARCGMMDGSIDSSVESGQYPETDRQSNFGSGYGYQYVGENGIDINIDGQWIRFETSEGGEEIPEQPNNSQQQFETNPLYTRNEKEEPLNGEQEPYMGEQSTSETSEERTSMGSVPKEQGTNKENTDINSSYTNDETVPSSIRVPETQTSSKFEVSFNINTLTSNGAEFIINNIGTATATTGLDFTVEKLKDGNWIECDVINENYAIPEIARILQPGENVFQADWSDLYGSLEKGTYRFKKTVYAGEDKQELSCEFTL